MNKVKLLIISVMTLVLVGCNNAKSNEISEPPEPEKEEEFVLSEEQINDISEVTKQPVADVALLTTEQVTELRKLKLQLGEEVEIIVPTYLPDGFLVRDIHYNENLKVYEINYFNDTKDTCFALGISGFTMASPNSYVQSVIADSEVLGKVHIEYTDHSNLETGNLISISMDYLRVLNNKGESFLDRLEAWGFFFDSPSHNSSFDDECKESIGLKEAIKVIESVDFLFSDHMEIEFYDELAPKDYE